VDSSGDLFIADSANNVVREVNTSGIISTVAGNGTAGYSGDGKLATNAQLDFTAGVAVDSSGDLFIADYRNDVVREVNTSGIITTIAGTDTAGYSGDGGPATSAQLNDPLYLAVSSAGELFSSDFFNSVIRQVTVPAAVVVGPDSTTATLTASPTSVVQGKPVTLTAKVTVNKPGAGTPTGTVTFYDGKTALGTVKLKGSGKAKLTTSQLTVGTHSITVTYNGDTDDSTSTSQAVTVTVTASMTIQVSDQPSVGLGAGLGDPRPTSLVAWAGLGDPRPAPFPIEHGTTVVVALPGSRPDGGWNGSLTITTSGEPDLQASRSWKEVLTKRSRRGLARPMTVFLVRGRGWRGDRVKSGAVPSPIGEPGPTTES
jgi:hypothetical protein